MPLTDLDPAVTAFGEFAKIAKGTTRHIHAMRQESIFADGAVPARLKALTAMLWAISARCEPCIAYYASEAVQRGATEGELGEFLAIASTMGGCVGEMWAVKAFKAYKDALSADGAAHDSCCTSST